jgi:ABC-type phosphate transport system auxiliary subunit
MQDNNEVVFRKQFIKMSRLKQNQIIDTAIQSVAFITQSQCSLSEQDFIVLNEALERLQFLKRKKGKTNSQIRNEIAKTVEILINFFTQD